MTDSPARPRLIDTLPGSARHEPRLGPTIGAALAVAALAGAGLAAYLAVAAKRGADEIMKPEPTQTPEAPEGYGLAAEAVTIETEDGLKLQAWYVPSERESDKAVALFHGHSASRAQLLPYARFLREEHHCLLVDFRASGDSEGEFSSLSVFEARDVLAAVRWLEVRGHGSIGVWGMSMGGAAAIRAAARTRAIKALVTEGTFDRVEHVIAKRARDRRYPFPRLVGRAVAREVARRLALPADLPQPVDLIGALSPRPVLVVHGTQDATSAPDNAMRLYKAAGYPKALYMVEGAGHTLCRDCEPQEYERRVLEFFRRSL